MDFFNIKIGSDIVIVHNIGNGFYNVLLKNASIGNMLKRNGIWILQAEHPFTDIELKIIGAEIENNFINS